MVQLRQRVATFWIGSELRLNLKSSVLSILGYRQTDRLLPVGKLPVIPSSSAVMGNRFAHEGFMHSWPASDRSWFDTTQETGTRTLPSVGLGSDMAFRWIHGLLKHLSPSENTGKS